MKYSKKLLPLLVSIACMSACGLIQPQQTEDSPLKIESTMKVSGASGNAASMYQLGRYYQGQNRFEQALMAYQKSLAADPQYAESHNGIGVIYSRQGQYDAAIAAFNQALVLAPNADHIHNNLGYAEYLQGHYEAAVVAFNQAIAINPGNQRAVKNLALAREKTGQAPQPVFASGNVEAAATKTAPDAAQPGELVPVTHSQLEVKQLAPAVFELKRTEAPAVERTPGRLQVGRIEVSNGNGVTGMARRVGQFLKQEGYASARLTNHKPFDVENTQVHYRAGYLDEAKALQAKIPGQPEIIQRDDLRVGINLRVVLGKDLASRQDAFTLR